MRSNHSIRRRATAALRSTVERAVPPRWRVPARYHFWSATGKLEREMAHLPELVGRGQVAIDVGANFGIYTYALSRLCEQVVAFEPQPRCLVSLRAFRRPNVVVHECGISDAPATVPLHIPIVGGVPVFGMASLERPDHPHRTTSIRLERLDDFALRRVSFIKIDVEGHERQVLQGGRETIAREQPVLLIEMEQRHLGDRSLGDEFAEIEGMGYRGEFLLEGRWRSLDDFDVRRHQNPDDLHEHPQRYVFNFAFHPMGRPG